MEEVIIKWIKNLIIGGNIPNNLIDEEFLIEDGMNLSEYWIYEQNSFNEFSKIFDLDENFTIEVIHQYKIKEKIVCHIYVLNKYKKIAFKMSITIKNNKISSNNFNSQIVPKYGIRKEKVKYIGMAIKSRFELENIISTDFEKEYFTKGSNFEEDQFYSAKFLINDQNIENKEYTFFLKYKNIQKTEKRIVFFDQFRINDCPYIIEDNKLIIVNDKYPVHLTACNRDNEYVNFVYPRNIILPLENKQHVIVTDVLDNDWEIFLNH